MVVRGTVDYFPTMEPIGGRFTWPTWTPCSDTST